MSGDAEQEYFSDGITEDIITGLSRFRSLFVIARNSSFAYKGRSVDARQIARDLGVRYIVEGSVRRSRDTVRVTAQLIDGQRQPPLGRADRPAHRGHFLPRSSMACARRGFRNSLGQS
jgi:TolB-like protein